MLNQRNFNKWVKKRKLEISVALILLLYLIGTIFSRGLASKDRFQVVSIEQNTIGNNGWSEETRKYHSECDYWYNQSLFWGQGLRKSKLSSSHAILANQDYSGLGVILYVFFNI